MSYHFVLTLAAGACLLVVLLTFMLGFYPYEPESRRHRVAKSVAAAGVLLAALLSIINIITL